jgi:peptidoglycan/xylan/chitin deacetylase (PgdA/CDA1 family)
MPPDPPLRIRWDRVGALATVLVCLVLLGVFAARALTGAAPPSTHLMNAVAATRPAATGTTAAAAQRDPAGCQTGTAAGTVVRHAPGGAARTVALTFDDGPSRYTAQVLDVLRRSGVRATFFPVGGQLHPRPELVAREADEGHLVGNHTWSHRPPAGGRAWPAPQLTAELTRTQAALRAITGAPTCWFRPPEGIVEGAQPVAAAQRMRIALWSVDSLDWQVQSPARRGNPLSMAQDVFHNAITPASAGPDAEHPVVLLHDGGGDRSATVAALPNVILWYQARGYTFVRLDGRS